MNYQEWWDSKPVPGWHNHAACRGMATQRFFGPNSQEHQNVCVRCPVSDDCLVDVLRFERGDMRKRTGVYGGMLPWQRQKFWRVLTEAGLQLDGEPIR